MSLVPGMTRQKSIWFHVIPTLGASLPFDHADWVNHDRAVTR
jgi:hypothetical protein